VVLLSFCISSEEPRVPKPGTKPLGSTLSPQHLHQLSPVVDDADALPKTPCLQNGTTIRRKSMSRHLNID
jgi:hypothetical protein